MAASKSGSSSKSKGSKPRKSSAKVYTDPDLRDRLKAEITAGDRGGKPGQWSARKAQLLAAEYEKAGGGYTNKEKTEAQGHLDQWTEESWTTADGEPAVREGETARYLPEAAWDQLTPAQKEATEEKKRVGSKEGKRHVANTKAARSARKKASGKKAKSS